MVRTASIVVFFSGVTGLVVLIALANDLKPGADGRLPALLFLACVMALGAGLFTLLGQRSRPGSSKMRTWLGTGATEIARPPQQVWDFIRTPELTTRTNPKVTRAFHVPGTPDSVGNQHLLINRLLDTDYLFGTILEIVAEQPFRRVEVVSRSGPEGSTYDLEPTSAGTRLAVTLWLKTPRHVFHRLPPSSELARSAQRYADTVKALMESDPSSTRDGAPAKL